MADKIIGSVDDNFSMTRRGFGLGIAGLVASSGMGLALTPRMAHASAPVRGGRIRVAMNSQSSNDTLDPARFIYSNDYVRGMTIYNCLARIDQNGEPQPELASSWEPDSKALNWTVTLRTGVTFHDGASLKPADVVYSLLRHKDPKIVSTASSLAANMKAVRVEGPDKVVIELNLPDAELPSMLAAFQFAIIKDGTTDFSTAVGTGPFVLKEFAPGVRTIGTRNNSYFKEGRPYLDEIEIFSIVDPVARLNALLSGDAQMISEVRGAGIDELEKATDVGIFRTSAPRFTDLVMRTNLQPSDNHDLRLAIAHLVDRQRYLDTVLKGRGQLGNDHPFLPTSSLYNSDLPQRMLDLDKAKFHLAKSGIGNAKLPFHVGDAALFSVDLGQILQRDASRIGLNIDLRREPPDSYWNTIWGKRPFTAGNMQPRPSYNMLLTIYFKTGSPMNVSQTALDPLDKLIDEARAALDPARRKELYGEVQKTLHDFAPTVLPAFPDVIDGVSNKVKGLTPVPTGSLGGFGFADQVWLEA